VSSPPCLGSSHRRRTARPRHVTESARVAGSLFKWPRAEGRGRERRELDPNAYGNLLQSGPFLVCLPPGYWLHLNHRSAPMPAKELGHLVLRRSLLSPPSPIVTVELVAMPAKA